MYILKDYQGMSPEQLLYSLRLALYRRNRHQSPVGQPISDSDIKNDFDNGLRRGFEPDGRLVSVSDLSEEFKDALTEADVVLEAVKLGYFAQS